jgi:Protein of unknown function (DUF3486)
MSSIPSEIRAEVLEKLKETEFTEYDAMIEWLASNGYQIARSTFNRWALEQRIRLEKMAETVELAKTISELFKADGSQLSDAVNKTMQVELLKAVQNWESADPKALGALAQLVKSQAALCAAARGNEDWRNEAIRQIGDRIKKNLPKELSPMVQNTIDDIYGWDRTITKETINIPSTACEEETE